MIIAIKILCAFIGIFIFAFISMFVLIDLLMPVWAVGKRQRIIKVMSFLVGVLLLCVNVWLLWYIIESSVTIK